MFNQNSQPFTDPDGDNLTLSFLGGPSGLVFTDNGDGSFNVSGTPTSGTSPWSVSVTATDGNGGSTTAVFSLTCSTSPTLDCSVIPSTINCAGLPYTPNVSGATSYNVTFSGSDYTFSGGQIIDTTGGSGGDDTATITATDGSSSCTATMVIAACSTGSASLSDNICVFAGTQAGGNVTFGLQLNSDGSYVIDAEPDLTGTWYTGADNFDVQVTKYDNLSLSECNDPSTWSNGSVTPWAASYSDSNTANVGNIERVGYFVEIRDSNTLNIVDTAHISIEGDAS